MEYEIRTSHDLEQGMLVTIQFPETEVDYKALHTIQNDLPEFLIPFQYRRVDGMFVCIYQVGSLTKLQYRFGRKDLDGYVRMWQMLLQPLLDCKDWFMSPYSFLFDVEELYTDREGKRICYLYVPSKTPVSAYEQLKQAVMEISRQNTVEDSRMENMVLRSIMQDFSPKDFLQMLRGHSLEWEREKERQPEAAPSPFSAVPMDRAAQEEDGATQREDQAPLFGKVEEKAQLGILDGEIPIRLPEDLAPKKGKDAPKKEKKQKRGIGFFGFGKKKKEAAQAEEPAARRGSQEAPFHLPREKEEPGEAYGSPSLYGAMEEDSATQMEGVGGSGEPCFLYIGNKPNLPPCIEVHLSAFGRFTIGRFDVTVGKAQSDFEFEKSTRGVSRHHAVVEKQDSHYSILDLQSSAGTYVNGNRLRPNEVMILHGGDRVSFGYDGADYIWKL